MDEFLDLTLLEKSMFDYYSKNNVTFPKIDVYRNFTLMLNYKIQNSYFGDKFMNVDERKAHFKWCWELTCTMFPKFKFNENKTLYIYLHELFTDLFYDIEDKDDSYSKSFFNNITTVIEGIFDHITIKTPETLAVFMDIYNVFNEIKNYGK